MSKFRGWSSARGRRSWNFERQRVEEREWVSLAGCYGDLQRSLKLCFYWFQPTNNVQEWMFRTVLSRHPLAGISLQLPKYLLTYRHRTEFILFFNRQPRVAYQSRKTLFRATCVHLGFTLFFFFSAFYFF